MIHLFLDDYRPCPKGFVLARNGEECLMILRECEVDILSLDYELGYGQMTGREVVVQLISEGIFPKEVYLHTSSMWGKREMYELLYQYRPEGMKLHNGPMPPEVLQQIAAESDQR